MYVGVHGCTSMLRKQIFKLFFISDFIRYVRILISTAANLYFSPDNFPEIKLICIREERNNRKKLYQHFSCLWLKICFWKVFYTSNKVHVHSSILCHDIER